MCCLKFYKEFFVRLATGIDFDYCKIKNLIKKWKNNIFKKS